MASEEKYLWVFMYQLHGVDCLWLAYFRDGEEAEAFIHQITRTIPCVQTRSLKEYQDGIMFGPYYYHHLYSSQQRADCLLEKESVKRDRWLGALAPSACDYLTSFMREFKKNARCPDCVEARNDVRTRTAKTRRKRQS